MAVRSIERLTTLVDTLTMPLELQALRSLEILPISLFVVGFKNIVSWIFPGRKAVCVILRGKTHDRRKEHLNTTTSSVYKHLINCVNTTKEVKVNIIARDTDNVNLRLKEAYYIRRERPEINSEEEFSQL